LNIAGSEGRITFSDEAIDRIYNFSGGIPRLINIVCDRALLQGFVEEVSSIDSRVIGKALEELT
jgi:general secretion pathway protein A